jgi:hypothetical protein
MRQILCRPTLPESVTHFYKQLDDPGCHQDSERQEMQARQCAGQPLIGSLTGALPGGIPPPFNVAHRR